MQIFWNKNVKIIVGGSAPEPLLASAPRPPHYYSCLLLQICRVHF